MSSISLIQLRETSSPRTRGETSPLIPASMPRVGLDDAKPTLSVDCSMSGDCCMTTHRIPAPVRGSGLASNGIGFLILSSIQSPQFEGSKSSQKVP
jgi:hypothetical protein